MRSSRFSERKFALQFKTTFLVFVTGLTAFAYLWYGTNSENIKRIDLSCIPFSFVRNVTMLLEIVVRTVTP